MHPAINHYSSWFDKPSLLLLVALVVVAVVAISRAAPSLGWQKKTTTKIASTIGGLLVLVCLGLNVLPLGTFHHDSYADVYDSRLEEFVPGQAVDITVIKDLNGHFARYRVADADFHRFLDALWQGDTTNQRGPVASERELVPPATIAARFGRFGWPPLEHATLYHSPYRPSGAGTVYYQDAKAGMVYHDSGYW